VARGGFAPDAHAMPRTILKRRIRKNMEDIVNNNKNSYIIEAVDECRDAP
jgi:hypothetical protein